MILLLIIIILSIIFFPLTKHCIAYLAHSIVGKPYKPTTYANFLSFIKFKHLQLTIKKNFGVVSWLYVIILLLAILSAVEPDIAQPQRITTEDVLVIHNRTAYSLQYIPQVRFSGLGSYQNTIIEVGCYTCSLTQQQQHENRKVLAIQPTKYYFIFYPYSDRDVELQKELICVGITQQEKYWTMHSYLLDYPQTDISDVYAFLGISTERITTCKENKLYEPVLQQHNAFIQAHNIGKIPSLYINSGLIQGASTAEQIQAYLD